MMNPYQSGRYPRHMCSAIKLSPTSSQAISTPNSAHRPRRLDLVHRPAGMAVPLRDRNQSWDSACAGLYFPHRSMHSAQLAGLLGSSSATTLLPYKITVENPSGVARGVALTELDGNSGWLRPHSPGGRRRGASGAHRTWVSMEPKTQAAQEGTAFVETVISLISSAVTFAVRFV